MVVGQKMVSFISTLDKIGAATSTDKIKEQLAKTHGLHTLLAAAAGYPIGKFVGRAARAAGVKGLPLSLMAAGLGTAGALGVRKMLMRDEERRFMEQMLERSRQEMPAAKLRELV